MAAELPGKLVRIAEQSGQNALMTYSKRTGKTEINCLGFPVRFFCVPASYDEEETINNEKEV